MSEGACALVCGLLSTACAILSWFTLVERDWECMIVTLFFSAIDVLIIGYVLAMKYCQ